MTEHGNAKGKVFILDDDELIVTMLGRALKSAGYSIRQETTTKDIINNILSFSPDVVLLDVNLPGYNGLDILKDIKEQGISTQVVMLTSDNSAETAVNAMKLGAADYLTKPFNMEEVKIVVSNTIRRGGLEHEVEHLRKTAYNLFNKDLVGESEAILKLKNDIKKIAEAHVPCILISGESGTGKELVARRIHREMFGCEYANALSVQCQPFIAVNCAALPDNLVESELFGHEKGAFTDAKTDKKGFFEIANGGIILLDEIGEMKPELQSKLLRVLEERVVRRIGGKNEIPVEVVVIATSNKDLQDAVKEGVFRKDLYFRLNTFHLTVAPLRERKEDIPLLAAHFLSNYAARYNNRFVKRLSREAEALMINYSWPGNVRELKNIIERIVVLERSEVILPEHLPLGLSNSAASFTQSEARAFVLPDEGISLDDLEKDLIIQAIAKANNNKTVAARLLNITYDSLRYQIKRFGL